MMLDGLLKLLEAITQELFNMSETRNELGIMDEQVAERAFEIFMGRISGGEEPHGRDIEDWLLAENQLIKEATAADVEEVLGTPDQALAELLSQEGE